MSVNVMNALVEPWSNGSLALLNATIIIHYKVLSMKSNKAI